MKTSVFIDENMKEVLGIALSLKKEQMEEAALNASLKAALDSVESALIRSAALLTNVKGQPISAYWSKCIVENEPKIAEAYSGITMLYEALGVPLPEAQSGEAGGNELP